MPTKLQTVEEQLRERTSRLWKDTDEYISLLETSSRLYKYSFKDQVLIHAQRPDAVACAEYDTWGREDVTNRYIKRGSKGIALLKEENGRAKLRYVFDFADTAAKDERSRTPFFWEINDKNESAVINRLSPNAPSLDIAIRNKVDEIVSSQMDEHLSAILGESENTFLADLDELNIRVRFEKLLKASVTYAVLTRCGYDGEAMIDPDDFREVYEFNSIQAMTILGNAFSNMSETILRSVELTLRAERSKENEQSITENNDRERNSVQVGRSDGNLSSGLGYEGTEGNRQIRTPETDVSERKEELAVSGNADRGNSERTSVGDRRDSEPPLGTASSADDERSGSDRGTESNKSDGLGGPDEQLEVVDRGTDLQRTDLRINENEAVSEEIPDTAFSVLEEAKSRINEYCEREFDGEADFSDLSHVDLAFTTDEETFVSIEAFANLNDFKLVTLYDGKVLTEDKYDSLEDMLGVLGNLEFDELVAVDHDEAAKEITESKPVQETFEEADDIFDIEPDIEENGGYSDNSQLSFFGDDDLDFPEKQGKKSKDAEKYYGVPRVEEAFQDEIMRGSGFANGKFRIESYYRKNNPDNKEFAKFLAKEYGTGGHSGMGDVNFADHDSKGITVTFNDGLKVTWNWEQIAKRTDDLLKNHKYITPSDIDSRIKQAQFVLSYAEPTDRKYFEAYDVLVRYGLHNKNAELSADMYHTETPDIFKVRDGAYIVNVEIDTPAEMWERFKACGLEQKRDSESCIRFETDGNNWNKFYIPDVYGNKTNSIDVRDVLTPDEMKVLHSIVATIVPDMEQSEVLSFKEKTEQNFSEIDSSTSADIETEIREYAENVFAENGIEASVAGIAVTGSRSRGIENENSDLDVVIEVNSDIKEYALFNLLHENDYEIGGVKVDINPIRPEETGTLADYLSKAEAYLDEKAEQKNAPEMNKEKHDFTITDENLGTGGAKAKYKANVAAIRLLNELEFDNRLATPEEQEVLSKYVGWGGLSQVFDESKSDWTNEYLELRSLLSPDEYEAAKSSTLTAYYTAPTVINAIYETLGNLGFKEGNVLEPSMGVGNFFGSMPEEMRNSKLYGVELDSISGRIAKQLYQTADIQVTGFEKMQFPDNFFDVAVGNVPFGQFKLSEKRYDKLNLSIHDHFFAKALDKVRAGGVIAFVTSKGTLDKENPQFRQYLAKRAELLGAIRLPNDAFKANAGTEVTSDIIFLQKRDKMLDIEPDWVNLGTTPDGIAVNKYFEQHPEMILGEMKQGVEYSMYGNANTTACVPIEEAVLKEQLKAAVANIQGNIPELKVDKNEKEVKSIPADPDVKNFSYTVIDDNIYYRENSRMLLKEDLPKATADRIKGMVELRDCVRTLIDYQLNEYSDYDIKSQQNKLNDLYDSFTKKYGLINSRANSNAFSEDNAYYLLSSLEVLNENGDLERKADMFTKRTIKQKAEVLSVDTASEALAVSISEKAGVDMALMTKLTGKTEEQLCADLRGVVFLNPSFGFGGKETSKYLTADEYLSGNIREKLEIAKRTAELYPEDYSINVEALTNAMPKPLEASEIDVRLGATWIDTETIKDFVCETLQVPRYLRNMFDVNFSSFTSEWQIDGKNVDRSNVMANVMFGSARKNAYSIIEDTLNLRDARVYDRVEQPDGKITSVLNKKETMIVQEKQEAIKQAFKDWIFRDPDRREKLVEKYNVLFNSTKPREYDGSHITFSGMTPEIQLRPHQLNAIAHTMYGGNTLLAHQVGAGKSFEMIASAMESKRLGLCTKSLFVVPNHLTEQMGAEFLRLYPAANILVATKKDFEAKNRKRLCSKIATGDYDAVIIGHSQLEKIPVSAERQERMIRNQIAEITEGIESLGKSQGTRFSVKQLEKTKKSLEARLDKLLNSPKKDDVVTFEELGIDKMFVDEAHSFKNLFLYTKMRNVAGIQQTEAQKSADLYMKCQYLDELTGGKGLVYATGTPISNSMTELYTMMRYLQSDKLKEMGMHNFDAWAANFGEAVTAIELAPEGTGYRAKTRFSKFFNLPELINVFKECADIKTADMLNLPVPEAEFHNVVVKPSDIQKEMVSDLSERAKKIHDKAVDPTEDNMLKVTNDGRKIGLDQRLINPLLPDAPDSKANVCVQNVFDIYQKNNDKKATQLIFCDFSTPKNDASFNLYDDIRDKLVAKGVPKEEIAFIHEADSEVKKKELFSKVRKGQVRVLIGSTAKCGAGTNIQDKLIALHHLDCPWRPSDLEQREGRIIRQGNENKKIEIFRYMTEATFDAYLYQTIENKQRFISQIMSSKSPVRSCEDVDEATLSYAEVKALCAGNPLIKEKMDLDVAVTKLKVSKANHQSQQYSVEDSVRKHFPERIVKTEQRIAGLKRDLSHLKEQPIVSEGMSPMTIMNHNYTDKEEAGKALLLACKNVKAKDRVDIGSYKGFDMSLSYDSFSQEFHLDLQRELTYTVTLGTSEIGNISRIDNTLDSIGKRLENAVEQLDTLKEQLETAKSELGKPFPQEEELQSKLSRLAELNSLLNIDENADLAAEKKKDKIDIDDTKTCDMSKKSVLNRIKDIREIQKSANAPAPSKNKSNEIS